MPTGMYFPTCIYNDTVQLSDENRGEKVDYLYSCRAAKDIPFKSMSDQAFTSFNSGENLHEHPMFFDVFSEIVRHASQYAFDQGVDLEKSEPFFLNSWGNIYPKGEFVKQHHHANALISGVYYLNCPEGTGGTYFVTPLEYAKALDFPAYRERHMKNFEEVYFGEETGRVVMFPGWLKHYTDPNKSDDDRVILSFNFSFRPREGQAATEAAD